MAALIILSGLPGAGKTSIARALARRLGAVHLRIDTIEQGILDSGVAIDVADAGYRAAYGIAEDNLKLGRTVIADSVNPEPLTRDAWRVVAGRAGAPAVEVEVVCSDVQEHRRRVETRPADIPGHQLPDWRAVCERDYQPWDRAVLVIDTAGRAVEPCAAEIEARLPGL